MKKGFMKFTKLLVLAAMIISDLMTPISVLANEISDRDPVKGDVGIDNKVSNNGDSATIYSGDYETDEALVTKIVTKLDGENGIYNVELRVKGKNKENPTTVTKPVYVVVVFDTSGSMICNSKKGGYSYISERGWDVHYTAADGTNITCRGNYNIGEKPNALTQDKWEKAVSGAVSFSESLSKVENTNISLVTFSGNASKATEFSHTALTARDFGHPEGGTNLQAGLSNAIDKLNEINDANAQKYIVVIGDGQPTEGGNRDSSATDMAMDRAYEAKNDNKITVFSIGYGIADDNTAKDVLKKISSDTTMTKVYGRNGYHYEYNKEEKGFYKEASSDGIADSFKTIFEDIKTSIAASNAVLTDVIGDNFKYVEGTKDSQDITVNGKNVTINVGDVTEEEKVYSFNIEIADKDSATGWYRTNGNDSNNSFTLTGDGLTNPITSSESAMVYWVQNTYDYVINYYRDEITTPNSENYLGSSDVRSAHKNDVIPLADSDKNTYLTAAGEGYEFNSEKSDSSLTISIDSSKNIINVVYTKKKLTYRVVYLFENNGSYTEISSVPSINGISATYGDNVNALTYNNITIPDGYTFNEDMTKGDNNGIYSITDNDTVIRLYYDKIDVKYNVVYKFQNVDKTGYEDRPDLVNNIFNITTKYGTTISVDDYLISPTGFVLNREKTYGDNNGKYVITDDSETIYIYYDRSNYKFNVNYHFNGEFDTTYNYSQDAVYGSTLRAKDYTLENVNSKHLTDRRNNDNKNYFLDPELNNEEISIGDGENVLNVYYISTEFIPTDDGVIESITKNSNVREVISSNDKVTYTVKYNFNSSIENIKDGDKVVFTITDKLPGSIDVNNSDLNGGSYDGSNNTITWVITEDIDEFTRLYEVNNKEINITYTVLYNDYISNNGKVITNTVSGNTSVVRDNTDIITTDGVTASSDVKVNINGDVTATYKDTDGNVLSSDVTTTGLVGSKYKTSSKDFFGYSLKEVTGDNEEGIYVEGKGLVVNYVYTKNDGNIDEFDVKKEGSNIVESINGVFNYTITASTVITDYVGDATLIVTDILPYAIDKDNSTYDNRCTYNEEENTITCKVVYTDITEDDYIDGVYSINEEFNLDLVFVSVDSDKVVNKVTASIVLDNNKESDEDEKVTEVLKGTVIATYKDTDGNVLSSDVTTTGLVGSEYKTSSKDFFGYSLKEVKGNEVGTYTEDTIYVDYIYVKTIGDGDIEPPQTGVEGTNLYDYLLLIGMLVISLKGYKKIKRSL